MDEKNTVKMINKIPVEDTEARAAAASKIGKEELAAAVEEALTQAKESGDFKGDTGEKGDPGEPGPAGPAGPAGSDYILTEADKTEIAEEAADIVDDALSEAIGDPDVAVPAVPGYMALRMSGAAVGQVARVAAVDADGKPTEWEPVEMPEGGGGSGEWITVADITLTEEVQTVTVTQDINGNPLAIKNEILLLANILPNAAATGSTYIVLKTYNGENDTYGTNTIRGDTAVGVPTTGRTCMLRRYKYHSELNTFLPEEILEAKSTYIDWAKLHAQELFDNFDYQKTKLIIPAVKIGFNAYANMGVGSRIAIYAR